MIYCLMNTGKPLSNGVGNLLFAKAKEMVREKKKSLKFKSEECVGVLTTKWEHGSMGTISGLEFKAEMAIASGDTTVTFLVRSFDFDPEESEWGFGPLEDLEQIVAREERPRGTPRSKLN